MSDVPLPSAPKKIRLGDALKASLDEHGLLLLVALGYAAVVYLVLYLGGYPLSLALAVYVVSTLLPPLAAAAFVVFGHFMEHLLHVRPFRLGKLFAAVRDTEAFRPDRLALAFLPLLIVPLFSSAFTSFKNAIPLIQPFAYDQALMELDRALHFGRHPWQLLQPFLGYPPVTAAVSYLYNLWLPLMYLILCWQIFSSKDLGLRRQYLMSFVLTWALLGSGLALLFSSAGPVYYGHFVEGPNPYAPLLAYLQDGGHGFKNWSLEAQAYLWENYQATGVAAGGGISAMPSLHIAVGTLQALLGWRMSRRLGWLLSAYLVVLLLGSVHLAWHYAVDGYLSIVVTLLLWFAVGKLPPSGMARRTRSNTRTE